MSNDQTEYEVFISYARRDNRPIPEAHPLGWVTALKEQIIADHRQYETSPLRIFFDTHEIMDMDDWRNRILGALRRSKVLLICLSPNYFKSGPCQWEWEEYQARQHQQLIGSDSHATVYFVEVPGTDEQSNARWLAAIMGKNFTDLRPWYPAGVAAMREDAVRQKIAALGQSVWQRIERARRALAVPGNVRGMTPYFVGRNRELADLHRLVGVGKIGLVTVVHGLGGQGKTEIAVAYARGFADSYPLGLWLVGAETQKELLPVIGRLGLEPRFGYTPNEIERKDGEQLGLGVLLELGRRADAARAIDPNTVPAALLILDNVSEPGLLAPTQLSKLPKVEWLRIIATTRLHPDVLDPARKLLGAVEVESLDSDNALRLIADHLPAGHFKSAQDEADARELVCELGGLTLAIEQVAVYLGLHAETSPGKYLVYLRANGLPRADDLVDDSAQEQIEHQTKRLRPILDSMLAPVDAAGQTLLKFAALLPPERIPWHWLKDLTVRHHPELAEDVLPDPWMRLRRQVQGLRFLSGSSEDECARMHRLIAAHYRSRMAAAGDENASLAELVGYSESVLFKSANGGSYLEFDPFYHYRDVLEYLFALCAARGVAAPAIALIANILDCLLGVRGHLETAYDLSQHAAKIAQADTFETPTAEGVNAYSSMLRLVLTINKNFIGFNGLLTDALLFGNCSLRAAQGCFGADHEQLIPCHNDVGFMLRLLGRPEDAVPYLKEAWRRIRVYERDSGSKCIDADTVKDNYVKALAATGKSPADIERLLLASD